MIDYNAIPWKDLVYYDETSPTFLRWISPRANGKVKAGAIAGSFSSSSRYSQTGYFNVTYQNHRIIWVLHNGSIVSNLDIDHIDGDRANNSIVNLRLVERKINARNSNHFTSNSGVKGVSYQERDDVFVAHWCDLTGKTRYKYFYCGTYGRDNAFHLACDARNKAIEELNQEGAGYTDRHKRNGSNLLSN